MNIGAHLYVLCFVSAFATAAATMPFWRRWCFAVGLVDDPGHRKIHDAPIPLAGGLAIMTALILPLAVAWFWLHGPAKPPASPSPATQASGATLDLLDRTSAYLLRHGLTKRSVELGAIVFGALAMLALGCLDDRFELKALPKFAGQFLIAAVVAAAGARITLFVPSVWFSYAVTILWIVTLVNALNFMDNMNGLCAGLGFIAALFFGLISAGKGQYLVSLLAFLTSGALLGFLPYNFPSARAFLGDGGSHLVGYLLAVLAILPHFYTPESPRMPAVLTPLFVLGVPLLDLVWVVLLRWQRGLPFYQGDTNHLSHRLVRRGFSRAQAVALIWSAAAVLSAVALFL